jgi:hypothetical protein
MAAELTTRTAGSHSTGENQKPNVIDSQPSGVKPPEESSMIVSLDVV